MVQRGGTYAVAGVVAAALWLHVAPLSGDAPRAKSAPDPVRATVKCDRTLSPPGGAKLRRAVRAKSRARRLCLRGGVYRAGEVWLRRRGMTITSVPGARVVWRGRIVVHAPGVTLERLILDGTGRGRSSLPSPTINGARFTLRESDVTNRNGICVHPLTYRHRTPKDFMIERNRIHDCGRRPRTNHDHGIYIAGGSGVVRWNAVFENADRGIQLYPRARGVRVYQNTIDGNGEGVNFGDAAARNLVKNNLITNSRMRWNVEYFDLRGRGNVVRANCLRAASRDRYYRRRGGIAPEIERYLRLKDNKAAQVRYVGRGRGDLRASTKSPFCAGMGAPDDVTAGQIFSEP